MTPPTPPRDAATSHPTNTTKPLDYLGLQVFTHAAAEDALEEGDIELAKVFGDLNSLACNAERYADGTAATAQLRQENEALRKDKERLDELWSATTVELLAARAAIVEYVSASMVNVPASRVQDAWDKLKSYLPLKSPSPTHELGVLNNP